MADKVTRRAIRSEWLGICGAQQLFEQLRQVKAFGPAGPSGRPSEQLRKAAEVKFVEAVLEQGFCLPRAGIFWLAGLVVRVLVVAGLVVGVLVVPGWVGLGCCAVAFALCALAVL